MMDYYEHLNEETNNFMNKSTSLDSAKSIRAAKEYWILKVPHFIYYSKAEKCLNQLAYLYKQTTDIPEDDNFKNIFEKVRNNSSDDSFYDLEGMTITGESGTGKTSIILEFIKLKKRKLDPNFENYPVKHIFLKDAITGLKGLYSAFLAPYYSPYANPNAINREKITIDTLEQALVHTLRTTGTKLLFIDEFQHALGKPPVYSQSIETNDGRISNSLCNCWDSQY